jgi:hypothetical protein
MQQPMPMQPQAPAMTPAAGITTEQIQKVPPFALTSPLRSSDRVRIHASCGVFLGRHFGQRLDHLAGSNLMHFIRMLWDRLLVDRISGLVKMLGVSF